MALKVGDRASRTKTISDADIQLFAQVSGDTNPVHLDEDYAAGTRFGRRIAHGMLSASVISAVLGNDLPGQGSIYLGQTLSFKAPVYIGDTITAAVEVIGYREDKRIATLRTTCTNQDGVLVIEGRGGRHRAEVKQKIFEPPRRQERQEDIKKGGFETRPYNPSQMQRTRCIASLQYLLRASEGRGFA